MYLVYSHYLGTVSPRPSVKLKSEKKIFDSPTNAYIDSIGLYIKQANPADSTGSKIEFR